MSTTAINDDDRSHTSHHQIIIEDYDDDFGETILPPSNRSTGGTPLRHISPLISPGHHRGAGTPLQQDRHASPSLISPGRYEDLAHRPRSNPRTRTPMRYESPLSANAFHRGDVSPPAERREGERVSIQPMAGAAVGTTLRSNRISDRRYDYADDRRRAPIVTKSSKQGPSRRKVRRWNNDNFVGIASEIAKASSRGAATAELLLQAQADAVNYRYVPDPEDSKPTALTTFIQDEKLEYARRQFFEGEIGHGQTVRTKKPKNTIPTDEDDSPSQMMDRIHGRLRNVIVRACNSSESTVKIVDTFEECLCRYYLKNGPVSLDTFEECLRRCILENNTTSDSAAFTSSEKKKNDFKCNITTLLEEPKVSKERISDEIKIHFHFDASSSDAGFHRLLLHAVCQFHGLNAVSTTVSYKKRTSRQLIVTGKNFRGPNVKLTDQTRAMNPDAPDSTPIKTITTKFNTIRV